MEPDELYNLRNFYWIGNYQKAIAEGSSLPRLSEALKVEAKEFVYRAYVALGQYNIVLGEIKDGPEVPTSLRAVKMLARYLASPQDKDVVVKSLGEWLTAGQSTGSTATLQLVAAMVYLHQGDAKEALRCVHLGATMEHLALTVQIFLQMDRLDLALKTVRQMQGVDEDATLTQLALAWTHVASGGAKLQEAAYVFEELSDKFDATVMLRNGSAVAHLHLGNFADAEKALLDALTKGQNDPDTLVNLICCYQHMGKPEELLLRYANQLKAVAPRHPLVLQLATVEGAFARVAGTYATQIEA